MPPTPAAYRTRSGPRSASSDSYGESMRWGWIAELPAPWYRGDRAKALEWLKASLDAGFSPSDPLSQQSELASLHGPEFDALLKNGDR